MEAFLQLSLVLLLRFFSNHNSVVFLAHFGCTLGLLGDSSDLSNFQDHHDTELSRQGREGGRGGGHTNTGGGCKWSRHRLRNRLRRQPLHPCWPRGHAALRLESRHIAMQSDDICQVISFELEDFVPDDQREVMALITFKLWRRTVPCPIYLSWRLSTE